MQGRLSKLIEKFRRNPMTDDARARLSKAVADADSVILLIETKEFQAHQERLKSLVAEEKTRLIGMPVEEFAGVKGAEQRGFIRGLQHAINQPRLIVDAGVQAEMQLAADERPHRARRTAETIS